MGDDKDHAEKRKNDDEKPWWDEVIYTIKVFITVILAMICAVICAVPIFWIIIAALAGHNCPGCF